jgi:hypothetical protein
MKIIVQEVIYTNDLMYEIEEVVSEREIEID